MEFLPAEKKLLYMIAPASLGVGVYALNPVLITGGVLCFFWIISRWVGPWKVTRTKERVCND